MGPLDQGGLRTAAAILISLAISNPVSAANENTGSGNNGNGQVQGNPNPGNGNEGNNGQTGNEGNNGDPGSNADSGNRGNSGNPGENGVVSKNGTDQDEALEAVEEARAVPLQTIADHVHRTGDGEIIDARLVTIGGFLLYEIKVVEEGKVTVLHYYARSGQPVARN